MTQTATDLRDLSATEVADRLREAKEELFNLRFQAATGQLESHSRLRTVKRDIARIYTVLREHELGIITLAGDASDDSTADASAKDEAAETESASA